MNNINLKGCGTALVTPFRNGEVDYEAFANDVSLKGEFVRNVMKDTKLPDEAKAMVARCGICALKGEDF